MSVDVTLLFAIWMGSSILLVPLLGLTMRYGIPAVLEAVIDFRTRWSASGADAQRRIERLERELARTRRELARLAEEQVNRW